MPALEDLFIRYRSLGDAKALGAVFDRTAPALIRIALHLCGNRQDADDLVQATFVRAIEDAGAWDETRPLTPWLVGILGNCARHRRALEARRPDPWRLPEPAQAADPMALEMARELGEAVEKSIAELPARYRPVLRLHLLDGCDPVEIAARLVRRRGTVRSQLARGLRGLRRLLPPGFAAGLATGQMLAGLSRVRAAVMAHAGAPPAASMATGVVWTGGLMLHKVVAGVLLLALLLWFTLPETSLPEAPSVAAQAPPARLLHSSSTAAADGAPPRRAAVPPDRLGGETSLPGARDASPTGSLRVRASWRSTGEAAASVPIHVEPMRAMRSASTGRRAITDTDGVALFAGLPVGRVRILGGRSEYGPEDAVDIVAGAESTFDLAFGGVTVSGIVVDADDRPVAGARIVVVGRGTRELGAADHEGRFVLAGLGPEVWLGARASGYAPSQLYRVPPARAGRIAPLRLVLPGAGGHLRCTVVDPTGQPVHGAVVSLGSGHWPTQSERDAVAEWRASTDEHGCVEFDGTPLGNVDVLAWAKGCAPWHETTVLAARGTRDLVVQLALGVVLHGCVRDRDGAPLPDYHVAANEPPSAAYATFGIFAWDTARTDAAGRYRLEGLPPGPLGVHASGGGEDARASLHAGPGDEVCWDPVLPVAASVPARVVGPAGEGLEAVVEGTSRDARGWQVMAFTDAAGRFTLPNLARGSRVRLDVRVGHFPATRFDGRVPQEGELVLAVPVEGLPTARIAGVVLDADGVPLPKAQIGVVRIGHGGSPVFTAGDGGRFDEGPFPPGQYFLSVVAPGHARTRTPQFPVPAGATTAAGAVRLARACPIDFRVHAAMPLPKQLLVQVADGQGLATNLHVASSGWSFTDLAAGPHHLLVFAADIALARHDFVLDAGGPTELDLQLVPGVPTSLRIRDDNGSMPKSVELELATVDGRVLLTSRTVHVRPNGSLGTFPFGLAPGAYVVRVTEGGRRRGELAVTVAPGAESCSIEVPLAGN